MPNKSSIPLSWRLNKSIYRLVGNKCKRCGTFFFPSRDICPKCRRKGDIEEVVFSGEGEIYSYTMINVAPKGFEQQTPYLIGIIKLKEGPLITGQIVRPNNNIEIGKKVYTVFRKLTEDSKSGIIKYGFKFKIKD